jgi:hypothetical protein
LICSTVIIGRGNQLAARSAGTPAETAKSPEK